jgi:hypothetical protein
MGVSEARKLHIRVKQEGADPVAIAVETALWAQQPRQASHAPTRRPALLQRIGMAYDRRHEFRANGITMSLYSQAQPSGDGADVSNRDAKPK